LGQLLQRSRLAKSGAAGATQDDNFESLAQLRPPGQDLSRRLEQHVRSLEWLDPPHEEQHPGILGHPHPSAGFGHVAGSEQLKVDAGKHDAHLAGVGAIQVDELH